MLRDGLILLTAILGVCSLPLDGKADGASKDSACPLETGWVPQPNPLDGDQTGIFVPASVRGTSIRAYVDTGAPRTMFNLDFAKGAGFKLGEESPMRAIGGSITVTELGTVDLTLAGSALHLETASATSFSAIGTIPELQSELVVGRDVLMRCAIEIDADRNRVRIGTSLLPPAGAIRVPITYFHSGGDPFVPVRLSPKLDAFANVDTGSQLQLTLDEFLWSAMEMQGTRETSAASVGMGGMVIERLAFLPQMSIGAMWLDDVETRFSDHQLFPKSGTIGLSLLARFNSIIDLPGAALWLSPRQTPVTPTIKSTSGLQVEPHDHSLRILHVMLNSPAAAIGLTERDGICRIDGQSIPDDYWGSPIRLWSRDKPGRVVTLTLCDGREKRLTLQEFY